MTFIIDAQLSPHLAKWITTNLGYDACSVTKLGLLHASDLDIFTYAREKEAIVITKDKDFVDLHYRLGSPPKILWITCGNTSNKYLKTILAVRIPEAMLLLQTVDMVEITD